MRKSLWDAMVVTATTVALAAWGLAQTPSVSKDPVVSATTAPAGTEKLAVQWIKISDPALGVMMGAVALPSGAGPHPVVVVLHVTLGFARE